MIDHNKYFQILNDKLKDANEILTTLIKYSKSNDE